jgi:hypothetical protein
VGGDRRSGGPNDLFNARWFPKKGGASVVAVHRFGGTAKVQVESRRAELSGSTGIDRDNIGLATEQLHNNGRPAGSLAASRKLRRVTQKDMIRQLSVRDPYELSHHQIDAAKL